MRRARRQENEARARCAAGCSACMFRAGRTHWRPPLTLVTSSTSRVVTNSRQSLWQRVLEAGVPGRRAWARHLLAEVQLLAHVDQRDLLRRGDHERAVHARRAQELRDADVLVARARRRVHHQHVERAPDNVLRGGGGLRVSNCRPYPDLPSACARRRVHHQHVQGAPDDVLRSGGGLRVSAAGHTLNFSQLPALAAAIHVVIRTCIWVERAGHRTCSRELSP